MNNETLTIGELHADHITWWKILAAWQQELHTYEERLSDVMKSGPPEGVPAEVEQFQNRLIREQEVIDELQHLIKTHEDTLVKRVKEAVNGVPAAPDIHHEDLLDRVDVAQQLHADLRHEFMNWLASVRSGIR